MIILNMSRAKILLDRINKEFNLESLESDASKLLAKAPIYKVVEELTKKVNPREAAILREAVNKLKGRQ